MTGAASKDLVLPPGLGLDFGVVRLAQGFLIVSTDPVTGVQRDAGWYAVNVSANDVATSGNRPRFMESVILLPEDASVGAVRQVSTQIHAAAKGLGISIVGGHTELTPGLKRSIVITTAFTVAKNYVSAADAREGDAIMVTKTAGLEGTAILASSPNLGSRKIPSVLLGRARKMIKQISIVKEAEEACKTGWVHAMHDCTEGGLLGAVYEMAMASEVGFELFEERVPLAKETVAICSMMGFDPLRLIGSGSLILAVEQGREASLEATLKAVGLSVTYVGRFVRTERTLVRRDGSEEGIKDGVVDELWRSLSGSTKASKAMSR